ncbi:nuclear transport factor 2 family protein [Novosphingobium sp.]|uniref:nuclear transport factor 2 family protein n=1 Tax=Novosphingobium sp. TaxID=1874826 RepID=UPI0035ADB9AE
MAVRPYCAAQELHDLAFRYGLAVDSLDPAMLASVFTRDGVMRGLGQVEARYAGAAGFAAMIGEVRASFQRTQHNVFNQTFDLSDDGTVTGLTTGIASHILPAADDAPDWTLLDFAMRYHNRYAKEDGVWKFAERQLEVVWVETRKVARFSPAMLGRELRGF